MPKPTAAIKINQPTTPKSYAQGWLVCMVASLYFFYIFIQMTKFNAIGQLLMADFKMSATGLGTLSSMYFWGNLAFLFPAGLLLDRFSTKKILVTAIAVTIIFTFLFSLTNSIGSASWCFLFIGLAGAFALLIPLRLATRWFPPAKMALVSGLSITIGFLGAMVSQSPLTWLVNAVGWRQAMQWNAYLGIVFLILMLITIKDFPKGVTREMSKEQATSLSFLWQSIKKVLANSQNWLFGIYTCLVNLPIFVLGAVFGANYLKDIHHLTSSQAAFANVLLFLGAMAGSPFFGWLSDKMVARKKPMYYGAIIALILLTAIIYMPSNLYIIYALFAIVGFFTSAQVITYPVIAESNSPEVIATGFSLGSTLIMSGGAIFVPIFAWLLDMHWNGQMLNNVPLHTAADYHFALWMLPISIIIAIIAIALGKETNCKRIA